MQVEQLMNGACQGNRRGGDVKGGATKLKVGGKIASKASKIFFGRPPVLVQ